MKKIFLICHDVIYCGITDEEIFFEWVKQINCIEQINGSGLDLYLYLKSNVLTQHDLMELVQFFKRYTIDMKQLRPYLTDENKAFFHEQKDAYWHKPLFGKD